MASNTLNSAINSKSAEQTLNYLTAKAEAGDPIAQRRLSFLYQGAKGLPKDPALEPRALVIGQ